MSQLVISIVVHETPEEIRPLDIRKIEEQLVIDVSRLFAIALHRTTSGMLAGDNLMAPQVYAGVRGE